MTNKSISNLSAATTPLAGTETLPIVQSGATTKVTVANLTAGRGVSVATLNSSGDITLSGAVGRVVSNANNQRVLVTGGSSAGTTTGAYIILEGYDYGGAGAGGAINLVSTTGTNAPISLTPGGTAQLTATTTGVAIPVQNITFSTAAKGINFTANTPAAGKTSQLLNWYEEGTWTPGAGSQTVVGAFTSNGHYTRIGRQVFFRGQVRGATSITGAAGSYITGLPFTSVQSGTGNGTIANQTAGAIIFVGPSDVLVYIIGGYAATSNFEFSGMYFV